MTVTARRMKMGARSITTGKQLLGQLHGAGTHVGPNALLRSTGYPPLSYSPGNTATTYGPMTVPACPAGYFRLDGSTEFSSGGICTNWAGSPASAGASPAYVYNNTPSNLGGIVPSGGMLIDGWEVPAGTYVFQFMDLSYGGCDILSGAPGMVFRGCRARGGAGATGFWTTSDSGYTGGLWFLYCDSGGLSGTDYAQNCIKGEFSGGFTCYRNYCSLAVTMIQPGDQSGDVIDLYENFIENLLSESGFHLNGITFGGAQVNARVVRNNIVIISPDINGNTVIQTDCISFFQDFGDYPGTGTNPDGTSGYQVIGNYMGGTGYCIYGGNPGAANMNWVGNLITASIYPIGVVTGGASGYGGGYYGPVSVPPTWGSDGNTHSGNIWADGADAGTAWA